MIFQNCYTKFHEPLGEWNLRQFWNITSGIYAKYHVQTMLLLVYTTTHKRSVIFTCRYFKLSRNTTALSQSNCWNFSCSSIKYTNTSFHKNQQYVEFKLEKLLAQSERKYIYPSEVNWRGQKSRMVRRFKWDHFSTTLYTCYCLLWVPLCRTIYLVRSSNFWFCGWTPVALPILFNGAVCFSGFYKIQFHISRASISGDTLRYPS